MTRRQFRIRHPDGTAYVFRVAPDRPGGRLSRPLLHTCYRALGADCRAGRFPCPYLIPALRWIRNLAE